MRPTRPRGNLGVQTRKEPRRGGVAIEQLNSSPSQRGHQEPVHRDTAPAAASSRRWACSRSIRVGSPRRARGFWDSANSQAETAAPDTIRGPCSSRRLLARGVDRRSPPLGDCRKLAAIFRGWRAVMWAFVSPSSHHDGVVARLSQASATRLERRRLTISMLHWPFRASSESAERDRSSVDISVSSGRVRRRAEPARPHRTRVAAR